MATASSATDAATVLEVRRTFAAARPRVFAAWTSAEALKRWHAPENAEVKEAGVDFRVGGKIFATLAPDGTWGMVKLTPAQQAVVVRAEPKAFEAFDNAWGRQGCTKVHLKAARAESVKEALQLAWRNTSQKAGMLH